MFCILSTNNTHIHRRHDSGYGAGVGVGVVCGTRLVTTATAKGKFHSVYSSDADNPRASTRL